MNERLIRNSLVTGTVAAALALLVSCGGGAEGTGDAGPAAANITSTGAMAVGSVIVNGIRFDDSQATVVDDRSRTRTTAARGPNEIKDGMTVRVRGRTDDSATGRADLVKIVNEVRGTISAVANTTPPSFTVAGITVYYDPASVVLQPTSASFAGGTRVEVHGARDAAGNLRATRIEVVGAGDGLDEVRGVIASVSGNVVTLAAAGTNPPLTINVSAVAGTGFLPNGSSAANLAVGVLIEVRGTLTGNTFAATTVVFEDIDDNSKLLNGRVSDDRGTEVEGFISGFTAATAEFKVGTRRVQVNGSTRYERGAALDLADNVKVEAEGPIDANGLLTATRISFRQERTMLVGPAQNVNIVNGVGSFTIFGKTVQVDNLTDSILVTNGLRVEVRGRASGTSSMVAERIRQNNSGGNNPRGEIQAVATAKGDAANASVTVLNSTCTIPAGTQLQLLDGTLTSDVAAWLNAITVNRTVVKVKGAITATTCVADEAEIEN